MCSPYPRCPNQSEYTAVYSDSIWAERLAKWEFDGNPDIAGIGVILSFFAYATLTSLLAFYAYFFADGIVPNEYYNKLDTLMRQKTQILSKVIIRLCIPPFVKISLYFIHLLPRCQFFRIWQNYSFTIRAERLQSICLQLADLQLITGTSILIVLYSSHCTITQYHFYIGSQMAYLSFVTFQGIFMTVQSHLQESFTKRIWRCIWIVALFGTVIPTRILTWSYHFLFAGLHGASAQCALDKMSEGWTPKSAIWVSIDCIILLWSLLTITICLFPTIAILPFVYWIQDRIHWALSWPSRRLLRAQSSDVSRHRNFFWKMMFSILIPIREFLSSVAFQLLRMYAMLIFAANGILWERKEAAFEGRQGDENEWGFGQVLPVLLLAVPLFQIMEEIISQNQDQSHPKADSDIQMKNLTRNGPMEDIQRNNREPILSSRRIPRAFTSLSQTSYDISRRRTLSWLAYSDGFPPIPGDNPQAMGMEDDTRVKDLESKISELEDEAFQKKPFQAWIILFFISAVYFLTWVSLYFDLPI